MFFPLYFLFSVKNSFKNIIFSQKYFLPDFYRHWSNPGLDLCPSSPFNMDGFHVENEKIFA